LSIVNLKTYEMKNTIWVPEPFEKVTWGTDLVTVLSCNLGGKCSISLNGIKIKDIDIEQLSPLTI